MRKHLFIAIFSLIFIGDGFSQIAFTSLDSLLSYAEKKSYVIKTGEQQSLLTKYGRLAAIINIPDIEGGVNFTATNNSKLQVNYFPAEIFGGTPGTYREVTMGQQYVNNLNGSVDIKLFNLMGWDELKKSKSNIRLTMINNLLNKQLLFNDIAATYFNIILLQEQIKVTQQNITAADTLVEVTGNRLKEGMISQKEMNDVEINLLNVKKTLSELQFELQGQQNNLKVLADIPITESVVISHSNNTRLRDTHLKLRSTLEYDQAVLSEELAKIDVSKSKHSLLPVASFFFSNNHLQSSNDFDLFNSSPAWVQSQYFCIKLSWTIPSSTIISQIYSSKSNYEISRLTTEHAQKKAEADSHQLTINYNKASSQLTPSENVFRLSVDSYQKSLNKFLEGLLSVDETIEAFNEMVNNQYNYTNALVSLSLAEAKIEIKNRLK